jgi:hypothetical protein
MCSYSQHAVGTVITHIGCGIALSLAYIITGLLGPSCAPLGVDLTTLDMRRSFRGHSAGTVLPDWVRRSCSTDPISRPSSSPLGFGEGPICDGSQRQVDWEKTRQSGCSHGQPSAEWYHWYRTHLPAVVHPVAWAHAGGKGGPSVHRPLLRFLRIST